jgi:hypothetical protein
MAFHEKLDEEMLSCDIKMVKKVSDLPVPSRDVTNQTLPGRVQLNYSWPGIVWLVTSAGDGKIANLFYNAITLEPQQKSDR